MDERAAIVTGAAKGVGAAVARRFLRDGIGKLMLVDMDGTALVDTAVALTAAGAEVLVAAADISAPAACTGVVTEAARKFGRVDILANCAGSTLRGGILDTPEDTFDRLFAVNVKAPFYMIQNAAKQMMKRKSGVIVNITSMLAHGGPPFLLTYAATKAAMVTVTKSAANTLKRDGVRVFAINLGWTVTPTEHRTQVEAHGMPENWAEIVGRAQPFGRLLMPEDVAGLCGFLISPDASMMTGSIIDLEQHVDGTSEAALGAVDV